jgi:recombinational DNA repair protein RecR
MIGKRLEILTQELAQSSSVTDQRAAEVLEMILTDNRQRQGEVTAEQAAASLRTLGAALTKLADVVSMG